MNPDQKIEITQLNYIEYEYGLIKLRYRYLL